MHYSKSTLKKRHPMKFILKFPQNIEIINNSETKLNYDPCAIWIYVVCEYVFFPKVTVPLHLSLPLLFFFS